MKDNYLKTSPAVIVILIVLQFSVVLIATLFKLQHLIGMVSVFMISAAFSLAQFFILLSDAIVNNIKRKSLWIFFLFIGGTIATIVYLVLRKDFLKATLPPQQN